MGQKLQKAGSFAERYGWILYLAGLLLVGLYYGLNRVFTVDFVPFNGDFQTYNALKRVLAGQLPYRDFANYLGIGPLLVHLPLLALRGTFAGSLFATNAVAAVLFGLFSFVVLYAVSGHKLASMLVSLCLPWAVNSGLLEKLPLVGKPLHEALWMLAVPGNSQRMTRLFLLVLYVLVFWAAAALYQKRTGRVLSVLVFAEKPLHGLFLGLCIGLGIVWSNDVAAAGFVACGMIWLAVLVRQHQKKVLRWLAGFGLYLAGVLAGGFLAVYAVTGGHPGRWLAFTKGVAQDQFWYYGYNPATRLYSLADWGKTPWLLVASAFFLLCMGWCIFRLVRGTLNNRNLAYGFLCLSIYGSLLVYLLGSGQASFTEGMQGFIAISALGLLLWGVFWLFGRLKGQQPETLTRALSAALAALMVLYVLAMGFLDVRSLRALQRADLPAQPDYVETLEGVTIYADDLRILNEYTAGGPVFSTYSTALDVMQGQLQPTGVDYIIHALGDAPRAAYLEEFKAGEYEFVQTLSREHKYWETWLMRVNWEFYHQLYEGYERQPLSSTWDIWQRGAGMALPNAEVQASITPLGETGAEIVFTSDYEGSAVVDVSLTYEVDTVWNAYRLQNFQQVLGVEEPLLDSDSGGRLQGYSLPAGAQTRQIPVRLEGGQGHIVLSSLPSQCTTLSVIDVQTGSIYIY